MSLRYDPDKKTARLNGPIGSYFEDGVGPAEVDDMLDAFDGADFEIRLFSEGGDVFDGVEIANRIAAYSGTVTVHVDSLAASIASVIAVSGDRLVMNASAMLMIHLPFSYTGGDAPTLRSVADVLDRITGILATFYADKSGRDATEFYDLMGTGRDVFLDATEALEMGLADEVRKNERAPADTMPAAKKKTVASAARFSARTARNLLRLRLR